MDINLTKDSSLLLHAILSLFYCRILQKTILYSGYKTPYKKSSKQENSSLFMNRILQTKTAVQEFHLRESFVICPTDSLEPVLWSDLELGLISAPEHVSVFQSYLNCVIFETGGFF